MTSTLQGNALRHDDSHVIQVTKLNKHYRELYALRDLTFSVGRGEVVGLLGPKGAGKTTLLRVLTGYMSADTGTVRVAGYDIEKESRQVCTRIGYLPENTPLYPEMTVADFLTFVARLRHVKNVNAAVERALEKVQLTDRAHTKLEHLARAQKQRIGIAQAIVHAPDVLIFDEPTRELDPHQILELRALIRALGKEHTILLATRSLPEVSQTCTRALIFSNGAIVAGETPQHFGEQWKASRFFSLRVAKPAPEIRDELEKIQGVLSARQTQPDAYEIETTLTHDRRDEIAKVASVRGWGVLDLRPRTMWLPEVFSQLTTQEPDVDAVRVMNESFQYV